ncbi:hypothetical protein FBU59_004555 [Linderina macrospora]|uniref:Uncharacterized protein n=1 Tax=Linderina macrospora TaxID=4868 RepID=A0ACC1J5C1_9FUNG|nr:hypothetical protein FBU59_004555 [Linderina macrospora]
MSTAATKKVQGGRKGKRAWRKNIDLGDVEQGLEELREEEREGGSAVQDREDEDLFTVDIAGDAKTKRQMNEKKLKMDEILGRRSSVPVPVLGKKLSEERRKRHAMRDLKHQLKKAAGIVDGRRTRAEKLTMQKSGKYDIWDEAPKGDKKAKGLESRKKMKHLSELPAVEVAHPGASYMPDKKTHSELVAKAGRDELLRQRVVEKHNETAGIRSVSIMDSILERAEIIAQDLQAQEEEKRKNEAEEASVDDSGSDLSDSDSDEESAPELAEEVESEEEVKTTSKDPKRKTRAARNRERRESQKRVEAAVARRLKEEARQLAISKKLHKNTDKQVEEAERIAELKRKKAQEKALKPRKKIGKYRVPDLPEAVKLVEELPGSLRNLKPESNAFAESYNSLLRRNMTEPRKRVDQKRGKTKLTEKWSYKDWK